MLYHHLPDRQAQLRHRGGDLRPHPGHPPLDPIEYPHRGVPLPVEKRDRLREDSHLVCNSLCFLETRYLGEKLTRLTEEEISAVEKILREVFDIG